MHVDNFLRVFILLLCFACHGTPSNYVGEKEQVDVEMVLRAFYSMAVDYNYSGMRQQCAKDFVFEESGHEWTLEQLILLLEHEKVNHTIISHQIDSVDTKVSHPYAWIHFHNYAVSIKGNDTIVSFRKASAALKATEGEWKLFRVESERQFAKDSISVL